MLAGLLDVGNLLDKLLVLPFESLLLVEGFHVHAAQLLDVPAQIVDGPLSLFVVGACDFKRRGHHCAGRRPFRVLDGEFHRHRHEHLAIRRVLGSQVDVRLLQGALLDRLALHFQFATRQFDGVEVALRVTCDLSGRRHGLAQLLGLAGCARQCFARLRQLRRERFAACGGVLDDDDRLVDGDGVLRQPRFMVRHPLREVTGAARQIVTDGLNPGQFPLLARKLLAEARNLHLRRRHLFRAGVHRGLQRAKFVAEGRRGERFLFAQARQARDLGGERGDFAIDLAQT